MRVCALTTAPMAMSIFLVIFIVVVSRQATVGVVMTVMLVATSLWASIVATIVDVIVLVRRKRVTTRHH